MSEASRMPMPECPRALSLLAQFMDVDLELEQSAWLTSHLESCVGCRAALATFGEIDRELIGWGRGLGSQNLPPPDARARLAASMRSPSAPGRAIRWVAGMAATVAAAVALAVIAPPHKPAVDNHVQASFIEIPYLPPLDPHENAAIVRMNISVATLIGVGYRIAADPNEFVRADVLVGEDGRAHAVRVLSEIDLKGTGD